MKHMYEVTDEEKNSLTVYVSRTKVEIETRGCWNEVGLELTSEQARKLGLALLGAADEAEL